MFPRPLFKILKTCIHRDLMKANFMDKGRKWCYEKDDVSEEVTLTENFTLMDLSQRYFLTLEVQGIKC